MRANKRLWQFIRLSMTPSCLVRKTSQLNQASTIIGAPSHYCPVDGAALTGPNSGDVRPFMSLSATTACLLLRLGLRRCRMPRMLMPPEALLSPSDLTVPLQNEPPFLGRSFLPLDAPHGSKASPGNLLVFAVGCGIMKECWPTHKTQSGGYWLFISPHWG